MTTRQYCDDLLHANLILVIFIIIVVLLSSLTRVLVLITSSGTLAHGRVVNVYCCLHRPLRRAQHGKITIYRTMLVAPELGLTSIHRPQIQGRARVISPEFFVAWSLVRIIIVFLDSSSSSTGDLPSTGNSLSTGNCLPSSKLPSSTMVRWTYKWVRPWRKETDTSQLLIHGRD